MQGKGILADAIRNFLPQATLALSNVLQPIIEPEKYRKRINGKGNIRVTRPDPYEGEGWIQEVAEAIPAAIETGIGMKDYLERNGKPARRHGGRGGGRAYQGEGRIRHRKLKKGSPEAKAYMAYLRSLKRK